MPSVCIICQRDKYKKNYNGTYVKEKLSKCETDGQRLLQSAENKEDERILLHTRTLADLAAAEVQYHRSCYKDYTRTTNLSKSKCSANRCSDVALEDFYSDVIAGKLLEDRCVLTFQELFKLYLEYAKKYDATAVTDKTLKKALKARFPGLHFLKRSHRNRSTLVYFHADDLAKYVDNLQTCTDSDAELEDTTESETESENDSKDTEADVADLTRHSENIQ